MVCLWYVSGDLLIFMVLCPALVRLFSHDWCGGNALELFKVSFGCSNRNAASMPPPISRCVSGQVYTTRPKYKVFQQFLTEKMFDRPIDHQILGVVFYPLPDQALQQLGLREARVNGQWFWMSRLYTSTPLGFIYPYIPYIPTFHFRFALDFGWARNGSTPKAQNDPWPPWPQRSWNLWCRWPQKVPTFCQARDSNRGIGGSFQSGGCNLPRGTSHAGIQL